ncbi:unnamed protein product [Ceratitis capitata]|uniref:(Mediterranean fruit fly) hypothetical protein n=1 Tax=Ceratitis capitata TaxID=7213 RepID=A0A811UT36_CERCA|nr:unnamed protein product [Ceratitis capitata]
MRSDQDGNNSKQQQQQQQAPTASSTLHITYFPITISKSAQCVVALVMAVALERHLMCHKQLFSRNITSLTLPQTSGRQVCHSSLAVEHIPSPPNESKQQVVTFSIRTLATTVSPANQRDTSVDRGQQSVEA